MKHGKYRVLFIYKLLSLTLTGALLLSVGVPLLGSAAPLSPIEVDTVTPTLGPTTGGETVTIKGSGFIQILDGLVFEGVHSGANIQYFDTGITQTGNTKVWIDYQFAAPVTTGTLFSARSAGNSAFFVYNPANAGAGYYSFGYGQTNTSLTALGPIDILRHEITVDNANFYLDGTLRYTSVGTAPTAPVNIWIGNLNQDGTMVDSVNGLNAFRGTIYGFKIWKSGVLVRDMVPAARTFGSNLEYGFYDQVSAAFFSNNGNGSFGTVPAVSPQMVTFGGIPATNVTVLDDETITCTTPAGALGRADVAVTIDGDTATLSESYRYSEITSVFRDYGRDIGGETVTLTFLTDAVPMLVISARMTNSTPLLPTSSGI